MDERRRAAVKESQQVSKVAFREVAQLPLGENAKRNYKWEVCKAGLLFERLLLRIIVKQLAAESEEATGKQEQDR